MDPDNAPDRLELADVAARLGITTEGVRKRIKRGQLRADKVDGRWLVVWPPPDKPDTQPPSGPTNRTDSGQGVPELVALVERQQQTIMELSGRCGWLQSELEQARQRVALLEAPGEQVTNGTRVPFVTEQEPAAADRANEPATEPTPEPGSSPVRPAQGPLGRFWAALWPWAQQPA